LATAKGDLGRLDGKLRDERRWAMAGGDLGRLDSKAGDEQRSAFDDGRESGPGDC
jgi:hypothetical protein